MSLPPSGVAASSKVALAHPGLKLQTPLEYIKTEATRNVDAKRWADLLARNAYTSTPLPTK